MAKQQSLIASCLIVELQEETLANKSTKKTPFISYSYPKLVEVDPFSKSVTQFCFPDVTSFPIEEMDTEKFSFVLTESDGDRRFGYCLRKLPFGSGLRYPIAFCVLAYFPCFTLFTKMLDHIAYHYDNLSSQALDSFIQRLIEKPLPLPGDTLEVDLSYSNSSSPSSLDKWRFTRPNEEDSLFEHVDFEPLLSSMSYENILICFASLLVERRTIFVSSKLSILSSCVQSILALLYPFTWQHICIPVLPSTLLSFCCAPMPFVVGILKGALQEVMTLPLEEVLIIDIDQDRFIQKPASVYEYDLLPDHYWTPVIKALKDTKKNLDTHKKRRAKIAGGDKKMEAEMAMYDSKRLAQELADVFLTFFVELLGTYRKFIANKDEFDKEGFIDSQSTWEAKQFMELFCGSQMFEMFIEQRKKNIFQSGAFEKRVSMDKLHSNFKQLMLDKSGNKGSQKKEKKILGIFGKNKKSTKNTTAAANFHTEDFEISKPTFVNSPLQSGSPSPSPSPSVNSNNNNANNLNHNNNSNNTNVNDSNNNEKISKTTSEKVAKTSSSSNSETNKEEKPKRKKRHRTIEKTETIPQE